MSRPALGALTTALAALTMACNGGPTGTGTTDTRMAGAWRYHAAITATGTVVDGVLLLSVTSSGGISGSLEAIESDGSGRRTPVVAIVSGRVVVAGSADFDMALVGGMVKNICFANARSYFGLELAKEFSA